MVAAIIKNVALEGVVTVVPPKCQSFEEDAQLLGVGAGQANRRKKCRA